MLCLQAGEWGHIQGRLFHNLDGGSVALGWHATAKMTWEGNEFKI